MVFESLESEIPRAEESTPVPRGGWERSEVDGRRGTPWSRTAVVGWVPLIFPKKKTSRSE